MITIVSLFILLFLMVGGGYYTLRFFSRLAGVNMLTAFSWGFQAKRFELVLTFILFYLMAFVMVLVMVLRPITILEVKTSHVGGLLGYQESNNQAMVYDSSRQAYVAYEMYPPPPTPAQFTDVFRVVSFYRPFFRSHYQNVEDMGLAVTLILIFIGALGLVLTYLVLYGLAEAYASKNRLSNTLSHQFLATQFRKIIGIRFTQALVIVLTALAIISVVSSLTVRGIMQQYREQYLPDQQSLKNRLETIISPGDTVQGRLIRRFHRLDKVYNNYNDRDVDEVEYYKISDFIIEFTELTRVPVYLNLPLLDEGEPSQAIKILDAVFLDEKAAVPYEIKAFDFIVKDDYSISLAQEK